MASPKKNPDAANRHEGLLVDLHVCIVPLEHWLEKYHKARNAAILESVSAGFIRTSPSATLFQLRDVISKQLGSQLIPEHYIFLRSVGRCLAVVNRTQETTLTATDFTQPAAHSELLILPNTSDTDASLNIINPYTNDGRASKALSTISNISSKPCGADENNYVHFNNISAIPPIPLSPAPDVSTTPDSESLDVDTDIVIGGAVDGAYEEVIDIRNAVVEARRSPSHLMVDGGASLHQLVVDGGDVEIRIAITPNRRSRSSMALQQQLHNVHIEDDAEELESLQEKIRQRFEMENQRLQVQSESVVPMVDEVGVLISDSHDDRGDDDGDKKDDEGEDMRQNVNIDDFYLEQSSDVTNSSGGAIQDDPIGDEVSARSVSQTPTTGVISAANDNEDSELTEKKEDVREAVPLELVEKGEENSEESVAENETTQENATETSSEQVKAVAVLPQELSDASQDILSPCRDEIEPLNVESETNSLQTEENGEEISPHEKNDTETEVMEFDTDGNIDQTTASKEKKIEDLKKQLQSVITEKKVHLTSKDHLGKRREELLAEIQGRNASQNNAWKSKYLAEKTRTSKLEEEIEMLKKVIETQYQKSIPLPNSKKMFLHSKGDSRKVEAPSQLSNQRNLILKLQREVNELSIRHEVIKKELVEESTMKSFAEQELRDLRVKSLKGPKSKSNVLAPIDRKVSTT